MRLRRMPRARLVLLSGRPHAEVLEEARRHRARHLRTLSRRRRTPAQISRDAAATRRWHLDHPERIAAWKAGWRRTRGAAYMRNYDAITPGRREYKAEWARRKRAAN